MAEVQKHGLSLELALRESARFFGASQFTQSLQAEHDIPAQFDAVGGKPTWVKAVRCEAAKEPKTGAKPAPGVAASVFTAQDGRQMKAAELCMADAPRFWQASGPVRLIVGFYEQKGARKEFFELREFDLSDASFASLRGGVPASEIADLRDSLRAFGPGQAEAQKARACAREDVAKIAAAHPGAKIQLRPKIDSKNQRRLQCAVSLGAIEQASDSAQSVPAGQMPHYGFAAWPWAVESAPRVFKSQKQKAREAAALAAEALEGASAAAPEGSPDAGFSPTLASRGADWSLASLNEAAGRAPSARWASESRPLAWH